MALAIDPSDVDSTVVEPVEFDEDPGSPELIDAPDDVTGDTPCMVWQADGTLCLLVRARRRWARPDDNCRAPRVRR